MKCTVVFLVLSMVVMMAEPGECIFGLLVHAAIKGIHHLINGKEKLADEQADQQLQQQEQDQQLQEQELQEQDQQLQEQELQEQDQQEQEQLDKRSLKFKTARRRFD
ncbi:dicentracin-like [Melanotaenia boesemani]|uniref:dicentracin-like n=1 Tax=Melanotaenia boesemani TaxID=1250792 RepID=UPI001C0507E6|nr:dicentracin-like [Melanotaenia boesemani]